MKSSNDSRILDDIMLSVGDRVFAKYNKHIDDDNVYIGRGSIFGNPFKISTGDRFNDRITNCIMYADYIFGLIESGKNPELINSIKNLSGKNVVCFCASGKSIYSEKNKYCHGHVILSISEYLNGNG